MSRSSNNPSRRPRARREATVELSPSLERVLAEGHPWVYRNQVPPDFRAASGDFVRVRAGKTSWYGLWDADSPLALRIFSAKGVPDAEWIQERVKDAWDLRTGLRERGNTTAYRCVAGEGDGLPGVIVDAYANHAVVMLDSEALERLLPWIIEALSSVSDWQCIVRRLRQPRSNGDRLEILHGRGPPREVIVEENGIRFAVDLRAGQKTGLFLDQRDNRSYIERCSRGHRVLNLFGYTGGFSLYAARGGALRVTTVDQAVQALDAARRNFVLNGFDPNAYDFIAADAFEYLERVAVEGELFDLVVCDPPSFGRSRDQLERALSAYARLNSAAISVTRPGGVYATASCTSRISPEAFRKMLAGAARSARRRFQIVHDAGHAADHPVVAGHPEGRYLKFVVGTVRGLV